MDLWVVFFFDTILYGVSDLDSHAPNKTLKNRHVCDLNILVYIREQDGTN